MIVDFPEPDGPTTKTNSPFSMTNETPLEGDDVRLVHLADVLEHDHRGRGRRTLTVRRSDVRPLEERGRRV